MKETYSAKYDVIRRNIDTFVFLTPYNSLNLFSRSKLTVSNFFPHFNF